MAPKWFGRLWEALGIAFVLYGMVAAQNGPSIPLKYCASVNTANMAASEQ